MFLLFTIIFLLVSLRNIIWGPMFRDTANEVKLAYYLEQTESKPVPSEFKSKGIGLIIFTGVMFVIVAIYLINAFALDPYKWPTIAALVVYLSTFIFVKIKKETEYTPIPRFSIKRIARNIAWVIYYGYILGILYT